MLAPSTKPWGRKKPLKGFRKSRRPGNRGQTVAESAYIDRVKRKGCQCCIARGYPHDEDSPMVEAHHVLSGGLRIGHGATIGLCLWHHKGQPFVPSWSIQDHREKLGPSLAEGSQLFHDEFGEDDVLLARQAEMTPP